MRTNTDINTWEIRDNKYNLIGNAKPKCWEETDRIASVSNVELSDKDCSELTNVYRTVELIKIKIGEEEVIVDGTDLILAVENALHSSNRRRY